MMRTCKTLKKDYVGETIYRVCTKCNKTYPRTPEFFYRKNHQRYPESHYRYEACCIECSIKYTQDWVKKNPERKKITEKLYRESDVGFLKTIFSNIKRSKHQNEFESFEQFFKCWENQQKIYGRKCPYTGIEMTTFRFRSDEKKFVKTKTNLSVDRILSTQPYNERNVMFISWEVNFMKGNINTNIAKKFLQFVKERYNTDEVE